jgi:hypothetical protein
MDLISMFTNLSATDPMIAGAISLWGLTVITYLIRTIPIKLFNLIHTLFVVDLYMNNASETNYKLVTQLMEFLYAKDVRIYSRNFSLNARDYYDSEQGTILGSGYGYHLFFYKKRFYWFKKVKLESPGSNNIKDEFTISTFSFNRKVFENLAKDLISISKNDDLKIWTYNKDSGWNLTSTSPKRPIESVAINKDIKHLLLSTIDHFISSKDWYLSKGIPYKQTFLLHGKPGTGKTSMIKSIASYYDREVFLLNLNMMTDTLLQEAFYSVKKSSILVIEDFDTSTAVKTRDGSNQNEPKTSLSTILNVLDGINSLDDILIFLTTNHLEYIDDAVYRPGRVDNLIEVGVLDNDSIKEYITYIYPDIDLSNIVFPPMLGCHLNKSLLSAKRDKEKFIQQLL